jgi:hypothetical protein
VLLPVCGSMFFFVVFFINVIFSLLNFVVLIVGGGWLFSIILCESWEFFLTRFII